MPPQDASTFSLGHPSSHNATLGAHNLPWGRHYFRYLSKENAVIPPLHYNAWWNVNLQLFYVYMCFLNITQLIKEEETSRSYNPMDGCSLYRPTATASIPPPPLAPSALFPHPWRHAHEIVTNWPPYRLLYSSILLSYNSKHTLLQRESQARFEMPAEIPVGHEILFNMEIRKLKN